MSDWKELIATLKSHGVEFLIVGAHALAFHARPRFTEDLDVFLLKTDDNGQRLHAALHEFGLPVTQEAIDRLFSTEREMIVLGHEPVAVDLMNFLDGVSFDQAWQNRVEGEVFGETVYFIGIEEYVATKKASGRAKDLADLAILSDATGDQY